MACITENYLNDHTLVGIWKIEEDLETLLSMVEMDQFDKKRYKTFRSTSRRLEFLSVRALLKELLGPHARIVYNKNNKPFLKDGSHYISISHSNKLSAIMLSTCEKTGIDLEYMSSNISKISFRFINKREKITRERDRKRYHLYLHWCAKEALYKICDKEGINIKKNITIYPFELADSGEIKGKVHTEHINEIFDLHYTRYDNYALVWTNKMYDDCP
ncbi:MAG: 4'-phosphopantetheinyl transferase superfamily protein [Marinilabiliaceae bacterium]|jgi:phosphopantetheinyl transferase|nr:4'-phosphopantetheinyl transferase superfamily protein [Marinilabiliaceae bacterium]